MSRLFSEASRLRQRFSLFTHTRLRSQPPNSGYVYDVQTLEILRRSLRPDSHCVDVGAHTGGILVEMLHYAPAGRHFAFEPIPSMAAKLRRRCPGVTVFQCALGREAGEAEFQHVTNSPGYSGLRRRDYDGFEPVIENFNTPVRRLDDCLPPEQRIDFIKIDVEGGEYHVLQGAVATIARHRPTIVFESGERGYRHYGVTAEMIHELVAGELDLQINTLERWLAGQPPLSRDAFLENPQDHFYYIGTPS